MRVDETQRAYFDWLTRQVAGGQRLRPLLRLLYQKQFVWIVPNDDNRLADGWDLRDEFLREQPGADVESVRSLPNFWVSTLEVLIALSRRLEFQTSISARIWAKQLLENLDLHRLTGRLTPDQEDYADEVLDRLIWRRYKMSGEGGFFPLRTETQDQRKLEIWDQMSIYLNERYPLWR